MAKTSARGSKAQWELITCIVQRGKAEEVFKRAKEFGAGGATIHFGRGTGVRERMGLLGIAISPEKEVITILSPAARSKGIVKAMVEAANLDTPGMGLLFVQPVHHVHGLPGLSRVKKVAAAKGR